MNTVHLVAVQPALIELLSEVLDYVDEGFVQISKDVPREFRPHIHMAFHDLRTLLDQTRGTATAEATIRVVAGAPPRLSTEGRT